MPESTEQYEEDENLPELPPVLPDEELDDLDGEEVDLDMTGNGDGIAPEASRKRRGSKKRLAPETVRKQTASRAMDIADWIEAVEHQYGSLDQPNIKFQLERLSPQYQSGVTVGGLLDMWESRKPNVSQIIDEWGGGTFLLKIQILKMGQPPRNLKKQFIIAGAAKTKAPNVPLDLSGGPPTPGGQPQQQQHNAPTHPIVEKRALDIVADQIRDMRTQRGSGYDPALLQQLEGTYQATSAQVSAAVEARARAQEVAAARQVQLAEQREAEARAAAELARQEVERMQRETADKVARATQDSQSMLSVLLPTFSENASRQVDSMTQTFMQREARIETQHAKEVDALYRQHEAELRQSAAQHQAEITRLETVYTGQLQMLQVQLQQLQMQLESARRDNDTLRNETAQLRTEQVTSLLKQADPVAKLQELGSLRDIVGEILPGGAGGGEGELSDDAPDWMKMLNNFGSALGPAIGQILEARGGAGGAGAQPNPQQIAYMQQLAAAQQAQQAQQQGMVPYAAAAPPARAGTPQAVATPQVTFERADLENAVSMLDSIRNSGTPPADAASAATKHLPHDMLRELARRTPGKVVEQLEAAGILSGQLLTPEGKQYVIDFLGAIREVVR